HGARNATAVRPDLRSASRVTNRRLAISRAVECPAPMRMLRLSLLIMAAAGCASAPPAARAPVPTAGPSFDQKVSWILRLEDQRVLRDPPPPAPLPPVPARGRAAVPVAAPPPPDLVPMLADEDPRIRRRAALAIGHVGLAD